MLAQGGDLVHAPEVPGACFVATLPEALLSPRRRSPRQRDRTGSGCGLTIRGGGGATMNGSRTIPPPEVVRTLTVALVDDHRLLV